jgi:hypothetical protein
MYGLRFNIKFVVVWIIIVSRAWVYEMKTNDVNIMIIAWDLKEKRSKRNPTYQELG